MFFIILFLVQCLPLINSEMIEYHDHLVFPNRPEYIIIPKFDKSDVPHWAPGKGRSYIDLSDLNIRTACGSKVPPVPSGVDACRPASLDILMMKAPKDTHWTNYWPDNEFCCTSDAVDAGKCTSMSIGSLIIPLNLPEFYLRTAIVNPASTEPAAIFGEDTISHHEISSSGLYVLLMANCGDDTSPVVVDGVIDSIDPYGYLPADLFGNLPFYATLSCIYLILALSWGLLCAMYSEQIIPLQLWISAVLAFGLIETTLLLGHYMNWNDLGAPTISLTVIGLIFGVTKRAMSRILVTLVALGYGVVRPSIGEDMARVLYLGGAYFVLSLIYTLAINAPTNTKSVNDSEYDILSLVVFLLAIVDTSFYVWIFTSLNNLIVSLASRKQGVKYLLYRRFRGVLIALLVLTCTWAVYSTVFFLNGSSTANEYWRYKWTVDALWEFIYYLIFVSIAVLWAPSNNSQRYAYSVELSQLEDDSEYQNAEIEMASTHKDDDDGEMDNEYGGRLNDEKDPFQGTGALDPAMAITKKN